MLHADNHDRYVTRVTKFMYLYNLRTDTFLSHKSRNKFYVNKGVPPNMICIQTEFCKEYGSVFGQIYPHSI